MPVTAERVRPFRMKEFGFSSDDGERAPRVSIPLSEIKCVLRNLAYLAETCEEMIDRTVPMVGEGVVRMTIDDARACARRIQEQIKHCHVA